MKRYARKLRRPIPQGRIPEGYKQVIRTTPPKGVEIVKVRRNGRFGYDRNGRLHKLKQTAVLVPLMDND